MVRSESGRSPFIYWYKFQHLFYYHGSTPVTRIYITKLNIEKLYPPNEGYLIFGPRGRLLLRPLYTTCTPTPTLPVHFLIVSSLHYLYTYTYTTCTPTHCVIPTLTLHFIPAPYLQKGDNNVWINKHYLYTSSLFNNTHTTCTLYHCVMPTLYVHFFFVAP